MSVEEMSLRVTEIDGTPWFVAADVCEHLGLEGYASVHTTRLERAKVKVLSKSQVSNPSLLALFLSRSPRVTLISESGLYDLALDSRKPEAKRFRNWVTDSVLPAIRKDGSYVKDEEKVATGEMSVEEMTLRVIGALQAKVAALTEQAQGMDPNEARVMTVPAFRDAYGQRWASRFVRPQPLGLFRQYSPKTARICRRPWHLIQAGADPVSPSQRLQLVPVFCGQPERDIYCGCDGHGAPSWSLGVLGGHEKS